MPAPLVRRGEATGIVTENGARTKFGHILRNRRTAHVGKHPAENRRARGAKSRHLQMGAIIVWLVVYAHGRNM